MTIESASPMTGPDHVREALRLEALAEKEKWADSCGYPFDPTDAERDRALMRAHLHASLARTAAMVDATTWGAGSSGGPRTYRDRATQDAWHELFGVNP